MPLPVSTRWHEFTADSVVARLRTSLSGLTTIDAARRLASAGPNALTAETRVTALHLLIGQFKSVIIWILIGAGVISAVLGDPTDAFAIFAIVVLNAAIGFYQEFRAEQSLAALQQLTAPQATVRRDGKILAIPAAGLVTGDILVLAAGDLVAADARLLTAASLKCIEAALTGESAAVKKSPTTLLPGATPLGDRTNLVFMGTAVATGSAEAVVVATAMQTELGRIAGLLTSAGAEEETPLQRKLDAFGRILVWAALGIVALLFGLGLLRGSPPLELLLTSISLAVAAVPEGLPAVVTVALSLGVLRMSRRRALVRKLAAVETLGSTNVICTDKTGTLTVGEMTAQTFYVAGHRYAITGEGYGPTGEIQFEGQPVSGAHVAPLRELATILVGCNQAHLVQESGAWHASGDPTEGALLVAGAKAGVDRATLAREQPIQHEFPFDSDRKLSSTVRRLPTGKLRAYCNGAPGVLLEHCTHLSTAAGVVPLTAVAHDEILAVTAGLARQSLRVLGSAYRDLPDLASAGLTLEHVERDFIFVGLTGMHDPPRPEAKAAIARCLAAGIRVVMITGDHPATAAAIAHDLGLTSDSTAVTGTDLDKLSDADLTRRAASIAVYARVTAEHKLRIVRALQADHAVVAMTGDGVNDAPAIKGADIGIAMGRTGTEVTKQAADMIITDDNFATIVAAVEEGRGIYDNIRKTLQYLLAGNAGELLLMTACVIVGLPIPLLPIHLLWINLVTDGLPALCLATDPIDPDVMQRPPRDRLDRLTDAHFLRTMAVTGVITAAVALAVFVFTLRTESLAVARTAAFTVLVFAELFRAFGARSETKPIWQIALFSNPHLVLIVALSVGLQLWCLQDSPLAHFLKTSPLTLTAGLALLALGLVPLLALEIVKVVRHARLTAASDS